MINWLIRTAAVNPRIVQGQAPPSLLSEEEITYFEQFTVHKRRQDWLLGRWTVKLLLQEMIRLQHGQIIALDRIVVLPDKEGAPRASIKANGINPTPAYSISISHSNGRSLCAAVALPDWPLGVDIERIEPRSASFAADFFTVREQQQLEECDPRLRETLTTAIWSGKEAALKAVRQGLRSDTRSLSCLFEWEHGNAPGLSQPGHDGPAFPTALSKRWLPFDIGWECKPEQGQPSLQGWWMVDEGFVLTMAAQEEQAGGMSTP